MPSDKEARKGALISSFWDSSFQKEGANDLAVWINYITTTVYELELLGEVVSEASKTTRLQFSLPIEIFREFKISHGSKVKSWDETVEDLRAYAMIAEVAKQLTQLSSSRAHRPSGSVFGATTAKREACRNFQRGACNKDDCIFSHADTGTAARATHAPCKHCGKDGHPPEKCWGKFPELRPARPDSKKKPVKNAEVVMQIVKDALDNGQTNISLQALLKALQNDPAKVFGFSVRQQQQAQEPRTGELANACDVQFPQVQAVREWAHELRLQQNEQPMVDVVEEEPDDPPASVYSVEEESDDSPPLLVSSSDSESCFSDEELGKIQVQSFATKPLSSTTSTAKISARNDRRARRPAHLFGGDSLLRRDSLADASDVSPQTVVSAAATTTIFSAAHPLQARNDEVPPVPGEELLVSDATTMLDSAAATPPTVFDESSSEGDVPQLMDLSSSDSDSARSRKWEQYEGSYFAKAARAKHLLFTGRLQHFGVASMLQAKVFSLKPADKNLICLDGGASVHITNNSSACFDKSLSTMEVMGVLGKPAPCTGKGNLHLQPFGDLPKVIITGAHVAEDFPFSFISESMLTEKGCTIIKKDKSGVVLDSKGHTLFKATLRDGLFFVDGQLLQSRSKISSQFLVSEVMGTVNLARSYASKAQDDLLMLTHRRHSHMEMLRCATAAGITLPPGYVFPICDSCVLGKSENHPHHKGANLKAQRRCQALHFDFCGPFPTTGIYGERYILAFIDGFTGYIWDFYPKSQTEFFEILDTLLRRLDNEFSKSCVSILRSDNAKVFKETQVVILCETRGIVQQFSAPYSQWQNGKAERAFGTILNMMRPSLFQSGLARSYWPFAAKLAVLAINRTPVDRADNIAKNFPPTYSKLERLHQMEIPTQMNGVYALGTLAFKHVDKDLRDKLDMKSKSCIYLGVDPKIKGAVMLPMDGGNISTTAVFTVNQLCFPLRLSTAVQASEEFKRDNGSDFQASPTIFWPPHQTSLAHLRDPRMDDPSPLPATSRSLREWQPSQQALENIANSAEKTWQPSTGKILIFSPISPQHAMDEDELVLLDSRVGSDYAFIYSVKNSAKLSALPMTRSQYQAATPSTFLKSKASVHAKYWGLGRKREVMSNLKFETKGPLLIKPPPGYIPIPTSFVYKNKYVGDEEIMPEDLPEKSWKARVGQRLHDD